MSATKKKWIVFILAMAIALVVGLVPTPTELLSAQALWFIGIFIAMLMMMIGKVLPDPLCVLLALAACVFAKCAPFATVFNGFASSSVWMVVALVGFSTGIINSGLMKRIAFLVLKPFKATYNGQVMAVMVASGVLCPTLPNMNAKLAIMLPFASMVASESGIEKNSKGAAGLFTAAFVPSGIMGLAFMTGSTAVFILLGLMPGEIAATFTWMRWFLACILWFVVMFIGFYIFITKYYKAEMKDLPKDFASQKLAELGPMSGDEKYSLVLLILALVAYMTSSKTGLDNVAISIVLWALMAAKGLFKPQELVSKIPWIVVLMMGGITGIATLFSATGISGWLREVIAPVLTAIVPNGVVLVIVVCFVTYLLRYAVVSMLAVATILFAIFSPICAALGINIFVVLWACYTSCQVWSLSFNNTTYIAAESMCGGMIKWKDVLPANYAFMVINLLANLACIPLWNIIGLM